MEGERCENADRCCASDSRCDTMDNGKTYICGLW
jgi:hypothetical protein